MDQRAEPTADRGGGRSPDDDKGVDVSARVRATEASRAQFLGVAFGVTFLLAGLGDLANMGTLRQHGFMTLQLLLSVSVTVLTRWTAIGRRYPSFVFAACMTAVSAAGAAHVAQFGGLDGPYFYGSYTAPPVMIPMLFSLPRRIFWTIATVLSFVVVYVVVRPTVFEHPMAHIPIVYLITICGISIGLGHYVFRLELGGFVDVARLERAGSVLEGQLRALEVAPAQLRQEVARQLHDDVAQLITGARIHLDGWTETREQSKRADSARRVAELLDELARRSRRMLEDLRAPPARGALLAELRRLRDEYAPMGLNVDIVADGVVDDPAAGADVVTDNVSAAIVACVREGLTNAVRHAQASEATVGVHRDGERLEVQVFDNGGGRVEGMTEGYGLLGIRERAAQVGGSVSLSDYPEGLKLTMIFSLNGAGKPSSSSGS